MRFLIARYLHYQLWAQYLNLKDEFTKLEKSKNSIVRQIKSCKQLMALEGVAEVCAGMFYSSIGNGKQFKNGKEASAFVGLTQKKWLCCRALLSPICRH
jgi:transposase